MSRLFTIVNGAAGGGRCARLVEGSLATLRARGHEVEVHMTRAPGHATELARDAYARGERSFLAVGGDGTGFEVINGLFPAALDERPSLGLLPLGTGNSFLRDFDISDPRGAIKALTSGRRRACDVVRCRHRDGELYYINLLSVGFSADAGDLTNRRFKRLGAGGYILAVLAGLARMRYATHPLRLDDEPRESQPCTLLSFSNSRFTGGTMMMAPQANPCDGALDVIRIDPLRPWTLARLFPRIFSGTHVEVPQVTQRRAARVVFEDSDACVVMVDGEVMRLTLRDLEVLPGALEVMV